MKLKSLLLSTLLLGSFTAVRAAYTYGELDADKLTCTLTGWTGTAPSGSITIPSSYSEGGIKYTVTAIGNHALDNMPEVTQVNLPASIVKIGDLRQGLWAHIYNFYNCPKLKKFAVKADNPMFASSDDGLLISKDKSHIYRIPEAWPCSTGKFILPENYTYMGYDAMVGAVNIKSFRLPYDIHVGTPEFYAMPNLENIYVAENTSGVSTQYYSKNGVLYDIDGIVACPPKNTTGVFTLKEGIKYITSHAFANCVGITEIKISDYSLIRIERGAFYGSGIKSFTVPASVTSFNSFAFANCKSLTSVVFENAMSNLQNNTFDGCSSLTSVTFRQGAPTYVRQSAFRGCSSLKSYTFDANQVWDGDSIFAGTGFTGVVYAKSAMSSWAVDSRAYGDNMFNGCKDLKVFDASAVYTPDHNGAYQINIGNFLNCPNLLRVIFPDRVKAIATTTGDEFGAYFDVNSKINHIVVGSTGHGYSPTFFCYDDGQVHRPTIFWIADKFSSVAHDCDLTHMFATRNGSKVCPTIYSEVLKPKNFYEFSDATYYVPGGAMANYADVKNLDSRVYEMYSINAEEVGGTVHFSTKSNAMGRIVITSYTAGSRSLSSPDSQSFDTGLTAASTTPIQISYTVDGQPFTTTYTAAQLLTSGVEIVSEDTLSSSASPIYFDFQGRRVINPSAGSLYIVRRGTDVSKEIYRDIN